MTISSNVNCKLKSTQRYGSTGGQITRWQWNKDGAHFLLFVRVNLVFSTAVGSDSTLKANGTRNRKSEGFCPMYLSLTRSFDQPRYLTMSGTVDNLLF
jgi:hypothetical protein